jgi:hypothetical protein
MASLQTAASISAADRYAARSFLVETTQRLSPYDERMVPEAQPRWLREAWNGFVHEWRSYFVTALRMTCSPRAFMREWATVQTTALNPLACLANGLAIIGTAQILVATIVHHDSQTPPWQDLLQPLRQLADDQRQHVDCQRAWSPKPMR